MRAASGNRAKAGTSIFQVLRPPAARAGSLGAPGRSVTTVAGGRAR